MQKRLFLVPAAVMAFILYFTVFGDRGLLRINHLHRDRDEMQKRLLDLRGENDKLKREITALQSDRRYLESIARRDFGFVRGNEVIYQFPSRDKTHPDKVEHGGDQVADKTGEKKADDAADVKADQAVDKKVDKTADKTADKKADKTADKKADKTADKEGR